MKIAGIIPARYDSTRLPGKPLIKIGNKTLIRRVYEQVKNTEIFDYVVVATDDQRIFQEVLHFGGDVTMTSKEHQSGTDRASEASTDLPVDLVVNIQGDEPFINKKALSDLVGVFENENINVATLAKIIDDPHDIDNPNTVKVVLDKDNFAIYFSRSRIPYCRNNDYNSVYYKHIGVYAFRKDYLKKLVKTPQSKLEKAEKLEQLRILENNGKIRVILTEYNGFGVDTPEDLIKARKIIKE